MSEHPPIRDIEGLKRRLMEKVKIEPSGCWIFTGSIWNGYGQIGIGGGFNYILRTHVASWIIAYGEPPADAHICHRCDNSTCCNPRHLYAGTVQDNMQDKKRFNPNVEFDDWADERPRPQPSQPSLLEGSEFARKFEYTFAVEELDYPWEEGEAIAKKYIETWERSGRRI